MSNKPDFFIVGAAKAGTTALQQILDDHPAVYMSPLKEPNFFYDDVSIKELRKELLKKIEVENVEQWILSGMKGSLWTAYLKDELLYKKIFEKEHHKICGEASVSYLYSKNAAKNIFNYNPHAKIIIILRNPAERAWSHFNMEKRMGLLKNSFIEEFDRNKENAHPIWGIDPIFLSGGLYYNQVKRYLDIFPKEQIYICLYDDFKNNPKGTIDDLLKFIGVNNKDVEFIFDNKKVNEARKSVVDDFLPSEGLKARFRKIVKFLGVHSLLKKLLSSENKNPLPATYKKILADYYANDIKELELLLGINLKNWK
jgi:DNA polymerase elongation subunit (family B)